jgi:hypothetical protein
MITRWGVVVRMAWTTFCPMLRVPAMATVTIVGVVRCVGAICLTKGIVWWVVGAWRTFSLFGGTFKLLNQNGLHLVLTPVDRRAYNSSKLGLIASRLHRSCINARMSISCP